MKLVKRLTILIFTLWLIVSPVIVATAARVPRLDTTDVMDDLKGLCVAGENFKADAFKSKSKPELVGMYEYGYGSDDYNLYFYIYLPDGVMNTWEWFGRFDCNLYAYVDSQDNQPISKYISELDIIDISDDGYFYKCKLDKSAYDISAFSSFFKSANFRIYYPEIDFIAYGEPEDTRPDAPEIPSEHYYDLDSLSYFTFNSTGGVRRELGYTLSLNVHPSMYRVENSVKGDCWDEVIYTAYFVIPGEYMDKYKKITRLEASWGEYHTSPVVSTSDEKLYSLLDKMSSDASLDESISNGRYNSSFGTIISDYSYFYSYSPIISLNTFSGDYTINFFDQSKLQSFGGLWSLIELSPLERFDTVFKVDNMNDFYVPTVGDMYDTDGDGIGDINATFVQSVDSGRYLGYRKYEYTDDDFLLGAYNKSEKWYANFFDGIFYDNDYQIYLDCFYYLKDTDMQYTTAEESNKDLYIGEEFWSDFYSVYQTAKANYDQVVLFRFAKRDYYSAPARYIDSNYSYANTSPNCVLSFGTAFLDFDIITLTMGNDHTSYTFIVDADPIDLVPGVSSPSKDANYNTDPDKPDCSSAMSAIQMILGVVIVLVVVNFVIKLFILFKRRRS